MPRDLVQLYPLGGRVVTLRTTEDDSRTRVLLTVRHPGSAGVGAELRADDARHLAGALLEWLVAGGHELPELPAMAEDLVLADEDDNPTRFAPVPPPEQCGTLLVRRYAKRWVIEQADPWVVVSAVLWDAMARGEMRGTTVSGQTLVVTDSTGARAMYEAAADADAGAKVCRRVSWRPAQPDLSAVHVIPEHQRRSVIEQSPER